MKNIFLSLQNIRDIKCDVTNVKFNMSVSFWHPFVHRCVSVHRLSIEFPLKIRSVDENLTSESVFLTAVARDFTIVFSIQLYFIAYGNIFFCKMFGGQQPILVLSEFFSIFSV